MPLQYFPPATGNIVQRLRADGVVLDGGGRVSQLNDTSGNGNNATPMNAGEGPLHIAASGIFAGQPAMDFRRATSPTPARTLVAMNRLYDECAGGDVEAGDSKQGVGFAFSSGLVLALAPYDADYPLVIMLGEARNPSGSNYLPDPGSEMTVFGSGDPLARAAFAQNLLKPFNSSGGVNWTALTGASVARSTLINSLTKIEAVRADSRWYFQSTAYAPDAADNGYVYRRLALGGQPYVSDGANDLSTAVYIAEVVRWNKALTAGEIAEWDDYVNTRYVLGLADPPAVEASLVHGTPRHYARLSAIPNARAQVHSGAPDHYAQLRANPARTFQENE